MKRSEMLDILQIFFESDVAHEDPHDARISACRVLDIIEDCGMLPPHAIITGTKDEMEGHIQNCQWEPENVQ